MVQSRFGVSLVVGGLEAFGVFVGGVPFSEGFAVGEVVVEVFEDVGFAQLLARLETVAKVSLICLDYWRNDMWCFCANVCFLVDFRKGYSTSY